MNLTALLTYVLYGTLGLYVLWLFYLAVMNLQRAQEAGKLSKPALIFGMPLLVVGLVVDLLVNVFVASVVLLELPRELTVTARLSRLGRTDKGWRGQTSCWFCQKFLDVFDPSGKHCK